MTCGLPVNIQCVSGSLSGLNCISHDGFALVSFVAVLRNKSMNKVAVITRVTDGAHSGTYSLQTIIVKQVRTALHWACEILVYTHESRCYSDVVLVVNATVTGGKLWPITDYCNNDFYSLKRFVTNTQTGWWVVHTFTDLCVCGLMVWEGSSFRSLRSFPSLLLQVHFREVTRRYIPGSPPARDWFCALWEQIALDFLACCKIFQQI